MKTLKITIEFDLCKEASEAEAKKKMIEAIKGLYIDNREIFWAWEITDLGEK